MLKVSKTQTPSVPARTGKFIAIYNSKGGVGKTEISRNIAHKAIELRRPIILFDVDSQKDSSVLMLPEGKSLQAEHPDFERTEFVLVTQNYADVKAYPERIVIADCPPQAEVLSLVGKAVNFWIIPVGCDTQEVQHALEVAKKVTQPFAFVLSRWDLNVERSNEFLSALFAAGKIFGSVLHQENNSVAEARSKRLPVWDVDDNLGEMFQNLADWVISSQCSEHSDYFLDENDLEELFGIEDFEEVRNRSRVRYEA
jgi:cellulose biosynthesis protein BcsQ